MRLAWVKALVGISSNDNRPNSTCRLWRDLRSWPRAGINAGLSSKSWPGGKLNVRRWAWAREGSEVRQPSINLIYPLPDRKRKSKGLAPAEDREGCEGKFHIIFQVQGGGEQEV